MAFPKYQTKEVLNKVLNAGEDGLNVDLADSVTVTVDSEFPAAAAITDNFANPTTTSAMSMLMGYDGSAWDRVTIGGGTEATALRVTIASDSTGVVSVDDGGGALTVDGTVTANLSATDNTVLDNIDSNTDYGATTGGGTESGALRVTIANNSTGVVSVDDGGGALTVDGTVDLGSTATTHLSEIEGAVETIETTVGTDGSAGPAKTLSVAGTESGGNIQELRVDSDGHLQVDVLSAASTAVTNAGTFAVQSTLAASDGTDIGDVDVTSVVPGVAATSLGKAIQSAQGGTDTGVAALVVRNDVLADLSGADGDYAPLQVDKSGALYTIESTGQLGSLFEDGTEDITSKQIIAIQFLEDTTFTTLTPSGSNLYIGTANQDGDAIDTSNVFPQGMTIFGRWTGYRLASGTIVAYQGAW